MKNPVTLTIATPCTEQWEHMTPTNRGRHCAVCSKTVTDYSSMSDADLYRMAGEIKAGNICGRFTTAQLNKVLLPPPRPKGVIHTAFTRMAAAALLLQGAAVTAWGQSATAHQATHAGQGQRSRQADDITIRGRVMDHITGEPLSSIMVRAAQPGTSTLSDNEGHFSINLPATAQHTTITLTAAHPGSSDAALCTFFEPLQLSVTTQEQPVTIYRYPLNYEWGVSVFSSSDTGRDAHHTVIKRHTTPVMGQVSVGEYQRVKQNRKNASGQQMACYNTPVSSFSDREMAQLVHHPSIYGSGFHKARPSVYLNRYAEAAMQYPDSALANDISGIVLVQFIVDETGKVQEVKALEGPGKGCEEEAVRAINAMPLWRPATFNGKAVKSAHILPIFFTPL